MNKNTKRVLSAITVASLSVTSFTGNIQNVVNAKEDKQEKNALSTNRVNAEVLENEAGAVIRVSASSNVQNVKTTYSVDSAGSKVVSLGDLKAGEVREIQVNFEEDSNKLKSLPKTTAVSDRVDFNKEVRGHKIKGSVSFQYDNGDNAPTVPTTPTKPVVTPTVPTEPTKPVAPVVTTPSNPTAPTNPVVTPVEPAKPVTPVVTPVEPVKPVTPAKPLQPVIPDTPDEPVVTPEKPGRPVVPVVTPAEPTKPVEPAKPLQPVIPDTPDEPVVTPEKPAKPVAPVVTPAEPTKPVVTPTEPTKPVEPAKPVTPAEPTQPVAPVVTDVDFEAGMPANVRWSRAQLKEWGFTFGKITGDYRVDGDLGVFDNDDALDPAFRSGIRTIDSKIIDGTMSFADAEKNTPHGYAWNSVTKPDGTKGYAMYLYGTDGQFNDGQTAR